MSSSGSFSVLSFKLRCLIHFKVIFVAFVFVEREVEEAAKRWEHPSCVWMPLLSVNLRHFSALVLLHNQSSLFDLTWAPSSTAGILRFGLLNVSQT